MTTLAGYVVKRVLIRAESKTALCRPLCCSPTSFCSRVALVERVWLFQRLSNLPLLHVCGHWGTSPCLPCLALPRLALACFGFGLGFGFGLALAGLAFLCCATRNYDVLVDDVTISTLMLVAQVQLICDKFADPSPLDRGTIERISGLALEYTIVSAIAVRRAMVDNYLF